SSEAPTLTHNTAPGKKSATSTPTNKPVLTATSTTPVSTPTQRSTPNPKDKRKTFTFVESQPVLVGSFAAGQFINRSINSNGLQIELYALPGSEGRLEEFGKEISQIFNFYTTKFGAYNFGNRFVVAEVDDDTLQTYSTAGTNFLAHKVLTTDRDLP